MARSRRREEEEGEHEEDEQRSTPEAERPLDSGTVAALRQADPHTRARTLLRLQRLHLHTRGLQYNPITQRYWMDADTSVNYMFAAQKAA